MHDTDTTPTAGIEIRRPGPEPGRHSLVHFQRITPHASLAIRSVDALTPRSYAYRRGNNEPGRHSVAHFEARGDDYITVGTLLYRAALTAGNGAAHYLQGLGYSRLCAYLLTSLIGGRL
ncbi:hypothetical protein SEA_NANCYRAE_57 [Gordonia phage NancyRae]|uniref:Uncharacterized protein n=1 Tax=Gordonia phage NancyRae TaxID=2793698 RepID=A0A7T0M1K2_9CAUD|nr:hypothetical protein SEA_NANCYRAE_57 [Gordonia phage NancyRae]